MNFSSIIIVILVVDKLILFLSHFCGVGNLFLLNIQEDIEGTVRGGSSYKTDLDLDVLIAEYM